MPVTPTYPGVYIEELASDVRTIVPVETATAAFIGRALRGPVKEPVKLFSFGEFEQRFGGLWVASQLGYAVSDFFLNGGAQAIIVRVYEQDAAQADGRPFSKSRLRLLSSPGAEAVDAARRYLAASQALATIDDELDQARRDYCATGADAAKKAKADGQYKAALARRPRALLERQEVAQALSAAERLADTGGTSAEREAANGLIDKARALMEKDAAVIADQGELPATLEGAAADDPLREVKKQRTRLREAADAAAAKVITSPQAVELEAVYEGAWGDRLVAQVTQETDPRILDGLEEQYRSWKLSRDQLYNVRICDKQTGVEEYYANVTLVDGPRRLKDILQAQSRLARLASGDGSAQHTLALNDDSSKPWWDSPAVSRVANEADKASDGAAPLPATIIDGINQLDREDFNLLCIPPYKLDGSGGFADVDQDVLVAAARYCERRRAILIVDAPRAWDSSDKAKKGFPKGLCSPISSAAVYFPRIKKPNPLRENQVEEFAPCGAVAGVIARTDFRRGVWKAPAGLEATLRGVVGLSVQLDDNANGQLNPLGINCLRVMPAAGPVVWGARTMEGDDRLASQWKYLPVRRMALWIEETLYRSTHWAVFEPNDEPLWSSLRLNIGNFMGGLFRQGAFQGRTPAEAYFVRCDASTTLQSDIDRGIVNVVVGFAPLKPAEFVIISIKQITNQGAPA